MAPQLTILVPVYNEENAIESVIQRIKSMAAGLAVDSEILIVDDGSTDNTLSKIQAHDGFQLLHHRENRGYGAALKTGVRHAEGELILILDGDGTYPPEEAPALMDRYQHGVADMVVGARVGPEAAIPLVRRPAKGFINWLGSLVAGERIPDINSGLRLFRREIALEFFDLLPNGFSFTTTITLGMIQNGYLVEYVPITYHKRKGISKIRPVADTMGFIQLILRVALYFQPLKIFLPISLILLALAGAWAWISDRYLGGIADASTAVMIMSALQVAVVGLLAELINARLPNRDRSGRRSDQT
jgi:glycosyltransferase involved in cell wall biosynthesis